MNNQTVFIRIFIALGIYLGLDFLGGPTGDMILYPIRMLVTFLHEFGHGLGALITGGEVIGILIEPNGAGRCTTAGGSSAVVLMGGYIGSAILGNILFYIGIKKEKWAEGTLFLLAGLMVFTGVYWFENMFTSGFLILFAVALTLIANLTNWDGEILMFLGLACIVYIIQDFNVGPSSDLNAYADLFVIVPANAWMYIWLIIVVLLFILNIRMIFRRNVA